MLSFVYDVADLYKAEITIPAAFRAAVEEKDGLERHVRILCRDLFVTTRLLERIIPDIQEALMLPKKKATSDGPFDQEAAAPGSLWDPVTGDVEGGCAYPLDTNETEANDGGSDP